MLIGVFVPPGAATLSTPAPPSAPRRRHVLAGDLYSARAKRRMAAYLRLRLLELREAGLERAVRVVERRLPLDRLLDDR